ncbi:MAG TPA: N-formylglutamate amidohydrolase [Burkholderiaceae bacterium]|jgi:N-formylglutamate amidohydrolase
MPTPSTLMFHGPAEPAVPLLLDSPHSGRQFPADFDAIVSEHELRDGEDCFIDELYAPAAERGVSLVAAQVPRTYIDPNRHAGDIDLALIEGGAWPREVVPSGKAAIGKALIWRTLDDGRPIYGRRLTVAEVLGRIERCHAPYHRAVAERIEATHARFGVSYHINCHSMNAVAGVQGEGGAGTARADFVLGDRDGSTCEPGFTAFVHQVLSGMGYDVKVNKPYKGVELVRAYSNPAGRRHSLQVEVNKRLYVDQGTCEKTAGFDALQRNLQTMVGAVVDYALTQARAGRSSTNA